MNVSDLHKLVNEAGFVCELIAADDDDEPIDRLLVAAPLDNASEQAVLELAFVPVEDHQLETMDLLQFYLPLPIAVGGEAIDGLLTHLIETNSQLPIGAFGVDFEDHEIYFRHILQVPADGFSGGSAFVLESLCLVFFVVDTCYEGLVSAAG